MEKNSLNLIWEAVGGFSKKISQLWIGFSWSQTGRLFQWAERSLQPWHELISADLLCLHSLNPTATTLTPSISIIFPIGFECRSRELVSQTRWWSLWKKNVHWIYLYTHTRQIAVHLKSYGTTLSLLYSPVSEDTYTQLNLPLEKSLSTQANKICMHLCHCLRSHLTTKLSAERNIIIHLCDVLAVKKIRPVTNPNASESGISINLQRLQMCHFVVAARFVKSILCWYRMSGNNRGLVSRWWPLWCRKGTEETVPQAPLIAAREEELAIWRWAGLIEGSWSY